MSDNSFDPFKDMKDNSEDVFMAETEEKAVEMLSAYASDEIKKIWEQSIKAFSELDQLTDLINLVSEYKLAKTVYKTDEWISTQSNIAMADVNGLDGRQIKQFENAVGDYGLTVAIEKLSHIKTLNNNLNNLSLELTHLVSHLSEIISDPDAIEVFERREGDAPF